MTKMKILFLRFLFDVRQIVEFYCCVVVLYTKYIECMCWLIN